MTEYRKNKNNRESALKWPKTILCALLAFALCMSALLANSSAFAATVDEDAAESYVENTDETTENEAGTYEAGDYEAGADENDTSVDVSGRTESDAEDLQGESDAAATDIYPDWEDAAEESSGAIDAADENELPEEEFTEDDITEDEINEDEIIEDDLAEGDLDVAEETEDEDEENAIMTLAVSGVAGITSFSVSKQVDGTAPWDYDSEPGNDENDSNNIVRTFDYVNYTLAYTTELSDPKVTVESGNLYVEFTLPCGPDVASFNMNTLNWMEDPVVTYYPKDGDPTTEYTNGMEVEKQVLTGYRKLENTSDNKAIPGSGTLSVGIYIGAATNGTKLTPSFTAWMDDNEEVDKVTAGDVAELTISAAQKYNIGIRQASEMNISGTYDLSTGNENASKDTVSGNTSLRGRMEGYGITVMLQNDSVDKGLKGLEFPKDKTITFDLTLSEQAENRNGNDLSSTAGYTPVIWDYDANLRKTAANGGSVGQWDRTWIYTNAANMDCAYGAAPFNKLGCHTYSTIYDSCYDGGSWHIEQDKDNPLVYHVTIEDYSFDYKDYNFPTANNTWYARTEAGTVYTANQACFSAGTVQAVVQFPENAVDAPTYIYYKVAANNFKVGDTSYDDVSAQYTGTYELVPEGSIQSGVNFTDDTATSRASSGHQLGSGYMEGDAYSFIGTNIRLWGYQSTTTDEYVRTKATLIKFDAEAFEINRSDQYYANGRYAHGSGSGAVNSFTRYFAGRSSNWESTQMMSDTLINSTDLHYYTDLDVLESAGYTCVGVLYIADVKDINTSSQSQGMIGLTVKDNSALIGNVYAACNDSWASYSTMEELEEKYGAPISGEGGTINTEWARNGYNLYKAYCSLDVYKTMKDTIESGNNGDYWYHKTEYGEDGNITGGHNVGYYGGTSLLICGEKSTVTIHTDKTVYDMDTGQRTTVVTVTPSVTVDGSASSGTGDKGTTTTTATVKVTLPADLTYDTGSAYWGDTAITPEVTINDDGTTVLTFTLYNVTLNETLDDLTFSCTIGHAGTKDDVTNNESISLNATIESTNDHRAKEESFGNSSTTSFNIIRLSATSISKSVDNRMIERNGSFTWTLNFYNGADEEIGGTEMADVFPTNGDAYGSSFGGSFSITGIEVDFSDAQTSYSEDVDDMDFYVSKTYSGNGKDLADGEKPENWPDLMESASVSDFVITLDTSGYEDMKAFYCDLGDLEPGETIVIRVTVQTNGNKPGDIYNNIYYEAASEQEVAVQSNLVTTQVVQRNISGRTWIDFNEDGIQDNNESALRNVTATLYRQDDGTQAVDVYGNTVAPVKTGRDGSYLFENLPAGTYRIEFSDVDGNIYKLTVQNAGTDDTKDSDASEVSDINGNLVAQITDVTLPEIEEMDRYLYESDYNDAGYSYAPVTVSGTKTWIDNDDQDGYRPASITIRLLADGVPALDESGNAITATVTEADGWKWSFTDLPRYSDVDKEIVYTVTEDAIDHYASEYDGYDVTNTHTLNQTSLTVIKAWDDNGDQDGIRPYSVTVKLLADGEDTGKTLELNDYDGWTGTFTGLDMYHDHGERIVYTVEEENAPDGYEIAITGDAGSGYTITNTHDPETLDISGIKTWVDDDDQDGYRPASITIRLLANGSEADRLTVTPDEDGNWSWSFTDLPKYKNGIEIHYVVTEDALDHYSGEDDGYNVTNTHTPDQTSLTVVKAWDDNGDQDGIRPDSVTVSLLADGEDTGRTLELNASNNWIGSFINLDMYEDEGNRIAYTVEETDAPEGYDVAITGTARRGYVITNAYDPEITEVEGTKTWVDNNDRDGVRPAKITVNLLADGIIRSRMTVTPDENGNWSWSFTDLPKYSNGGVEIAYSVTENALDNYSTEYDGFDITNTYTPGQTSLTVVKAWDDNGDRDGVRPNSISVKLLEDGEDTGKTLNLSSSNNWIGTFANLDITTDGVDNVYTVKETEVEGYTGTVAGNAADGFVITNKLVASVENPDTGNPNTGNPKQGVRTGDTNVVPILLIIIFIAAAAVVVVLVWWMTGRRIRR